MKDAEQQHLQELGFTPDTIAMLKRFNLNYLGPCPEKLLSQFHATQKGTQQFTQQETARQFVLVLDPKLGTDGLLWALIDAGRAELRHEISAVWDQFERMLKPR